MEPNTLATVLILISAAVHASWNAMVKRAEDKLAIMLFISGFGGLLFIPFVPFVPLPDLTMWGFIAASICIHIVYQLALTRALDVGELTFVYPVARGLGPLLVALFSLVFLSGDLTAGEFVAVLVLVTGIFATMGGRLTNRKGLAPALLTGFMIATYTLVDGFAVKTAANPFTYIVWAALAYAPVFFLYIGLTRGPAFILKAARTWKHGLPAAVMSQGGYGLALLALSLGTIGEVAALRETSILFATLIGTVWLKENVTPRKILAVSLIALGAIGLKLI